MLEFTLPTMTCGHCVRAVTDAVKAVDAEAEVEIDLPAHQLTVQTEVPRETLAARLTEAGYAPA